MARDPLYAHVEAVDVEFPHLLRWNNVAACTEYTQRVLARLDGDWGHVGKPQGQAGYTLPNQVRVSYDVIFSKSRNLQVDIVGGGGGHPAPGTPEWQEIDRALYRSNNPWTPKQSQIFISDAPTTITGPKPAKLGISLFSLIRALKDWPADLKKNVEFINAELNPEYFRVFMDLEGRSHGDPDPWLLAGCNIMDARWSDDFKRALDYIGGLGKQIHATMYGGVNNARDLDARRRAHDKFVGACQGRWEVIDGVEGANEFNVNRFEPSDVRAIVNDLGSKLPAGIGLSASSPALAHGEVEIGGGFGDPTNEDMEESIREIYGNTVANQMVVHVMRKPSSKWASPFSYNVFAAGLRKRNNEPPGFDASAGGDVKDPQELLRQYKETGAAGWSHHTVHPRWGIWQGRIPSKYADKAPEQNIWDHGPRLTEMFNLIRDARYADGTVTPPRPLPPNVGGTGKLLTGMSLLPEQTLVSPGGHARLHYQSDGNLVVYLDGIAFWASHTDGHPAGSLQMQPDGNLVLYDANGPVWSTDTSGHAGAMVQLQDDGNFVVYEDPSGPKAGTPLWASQAA